jgi:uncharacterized low-complexity protein
MNIHKNARLAPLRREEMAVAVLGGALTKAQAARIKRVRNVKPLWSKLGTGSASRSAVSTCGPTRCSVSPSSVR